MAIDANAIVSIEVDAKLPKPAASERFFYLEKGALSLNPPQDEFAGISQFPNR